MPYDNTRKTTLTPITFRDKELRFFYTLFQSLRDALRSNLDFQAAENNFDVANIPCIVRQAVRPCTYDVFNYRGISNAP